jgi:osmotically-inducible protein OsmY
MNTKLAATLVIGALLAPVAVYAAEKSTTETVKEAVSDTVITGKIKAEFAKDKTVDAIDITVDTDNKGAVTLSGKAKSKAQADQAAKIARETKGVTSVKNNITVGDSGVKKSEVKSEMKTESGGKKSVTENVKEHVSDSVITAKIKTEYAKDKKVDMLDISVETDDKGAVTLGGKAKSKTEADQAVKIARETKGVTSVKSNITVQAK